MRHPTTIVGVNLNDRQVDELGSSLLIMKTMGIKGRETIAIHALYYMYHWLLSILQRLECSHSSGAGEMFVTHDIRATHDRDNMASVVDVITSCESSDVMTLSGVPSPECYLSSLGVSS